MKSIILRKKKGFSSHSDSGFMKNFCLLKKLLRLLYISYFVTKKPQSATSSIMLCGKILKLRLHL